MALQLTAAPQISGQTATAFTSYCYLYEPLKVTITEGTGIVPTKYYIELEVRSTSDYATIVESISQYAVFDVNAGEGLTVDLMKIARQYHDANIYKFANIDDIAGADGWKSVISQYIYNFRITSDASACLLYTSDAADE